MRDILENAETAVERGDIGPGKANRERDAQKFPKRFFETVTVDEMENGFAILLDKKPVKTPGKQTLLLPNKACADLVRVEWDALEKEINPLKLPVTRLANTAIDGVSQEIQAVKEDIIRFVGTDLTCYRADSPEGLVNNQKAQWDPILDWAQSSLNANFELVTGIMHVTQPKSAIASFSAALNSCNDPFELTCLHTITTLTGSALIALALTEGKMDADTAWSAAHVDEDWNISQWGEDFEAAERRKQRHIDFSAAIKLLTALRA